MENTGVREELDLNVIMDALVAEHPPDTATAHNWIFALITEVQALRFERERLRAERRDKNNGF